jgi:hypothetical protein
LSTLISQDVIIEGKTIEIFATALRIANHCFLFWQRKFRLELLNVVPQMLMMMSVATELSDYGREVSSRVKDKNVLT